MKINLFRKNKNYLFSEMLNKKKLKGNSRVIAAATAVNRKQLKIFKKT